MPTYEYKCPTCEHKQQLSHKMNDQPITICPSCMKSDMIKGPGGGLGIHYKCTGFYETDYKRK